MYSLKEQKRKQKARRLKNDFEYYAKNSLKIRTKEGEITYLNLNAAQQYIHKKIEAQLQKKGCVRAIILKGRQQGCSTYVTGRYYWKVSSRRGVKCFIVTHRDDATANLYKLVKRYHDNLPEAIKPSTGVSNAKELYFDILDSGYGIGTAGSGNIGRSDTIQYFHGSECAFWQNTTEIQTGILQTIPDMKDTEIILESTANGMGNMFHKYCLDALAGKNGYELIFIPWFWQKEYRIPLPENFALTPEELQYKTAHKLDDNQMAWRRNKISTFRDGERQFKQEYPATVREAFQVSGEQVVINSEVIDHCLEYKSTNSHRFSAVIGVDVAREDKDKSVIVVRRHDKIECVRKFHNLDGQQLAQKIIQTSKDFDTKYIFIDAIGVGSSPIDFLKYFGYKHIPVYTGKQAEDSLLYANKRAEIWFRLAEAMKEGLEIPHDEELLLQLQSQTYRYRVNNQLILPSKEEMRKDGLPSPDIADAICLTYSFLYNTLCTNVRQTRVINNSNNDILRRN